MLGLTDLQVERSIGTMPPTLEPMFKQVGKTTFWRIYPHRRTIDAVNGSELFSQPLGTGSPQSIPAELGLVDAGRTGTARLTLEKLAEFN